MAAKKKAAKKKPAKKKAAAKKNAAAKKTFRKGDSVEWKTSQGKTRGKVVKKLTATTNVSNEKSQKGTTVKATKDDPYYLVESNKTGKQAAHKPGSLKKV